MTRPAGHPARYNGTRPRCDRPIVAGKTRIIIRPTGAVCARCWEEERE